MTSDTPRTDKALTGDGIVEVRLALLASTLERELAAATADRDALRLRVAQLEGIGDMWRAAELALADVKRDRDGYALQVQRLNDELRQAMRGAQ